MHYLNNVIAKDSKQQNNKKYHKPTYTELRNSFNQNPVRVRFSVVFAHHLFTHFPCCPCLINGNSLGCRVFIIIHFNNQLLHSCRPEFLQSYPYFFSFDSLMLFFLQIRPFDNIQSYDQYSCSLNRFLCNSFNVSCENLLSIIWIEWQNKALLLTGVSSLVSSWTVSNRLRTSADTYKYTSINTAFSIYMLILPSIYCSALARCTVINWLLNTPPPPPKKKTTTKNKKQKTKKTKKKTTHTQKSLSCTKIKYQH